MEIKIIDCHQDVLDPRVLITKYEPSIDEKLQAGLNVDTRQSFRPKKNNVSP